MPPSIHDRIRGCLLGGAVGDALGAPVEFLSLEEIRRRFGDAGPADFAPWAGPLGGITDDTQMTLFTAEALIRGLNRARAEGSEPDWPELFRAAYWRWLATQGGRPRNELATLSVLTSWLSSDPELNDRRAPGATCLDALTSGRLGTVDEPINDRKGCGGVMRVAPVGLAGLPDPFGVGCAAAAVSHGHPTGWLAAGCLARLIAELADGVGLARAVAAALDETRRLPQSDEVVAACDAAADLAAAGPATAERVESLGGGFIAEEALAIAVYCALAADDVEHGVRLAVTHSGDSDSTGSIAGQILGVRSGAGAVPARWLAHLELRRLIERVADDLYGAARRPEAMIDGACYDWVRYPGL